MISVLKHPTADALREYARLATVIDGEIQEHLDRCELCKAIEQAERERLASLLAGSDEPLPPRTT